MPQDNKRWAVLGNHRMADKAFVWPGDRIFNVGSYYI